MKKYNLKESLIQMDLDTDFKYTLTDLYEACQLSENKKKELVQYIEDRDPVGMNAMLCNEVGVMTENVSDDIPDDEMPELEGWSPDMSECPACGDVTFNSKSGRCNACSYRESLEEAVEYVKWVQLPNGKWKMWGSNPDSELDPDFLDRAIKQNGINYKDAKVAMNGEYPEGVTENDVQEKNGTIEESFAEGDMVWVKPSNKPGRVVSVKGDVVEVEIEGGNDPDRRDTFYASDLELEKSLDESTLNEGPFSILGDLAGKGVGDAWKGVKNFAKGVKDTAKDVKKTAIEVRDGVKQSKDAAKVRDAWRAMKSSDTVDQFKADYQRRQDARSKSDTKRDKVYKGKIGKSIGDKQDWKFVVNGKKLSYDQFMAIPQAQRHQLVAQKKVKVLDLMGRETSFKDHNKRLKEYFLLENFELEPDYSIYNLTDDQIEQVKFIENNLDTPAGYKAYYELEKEITDEGGCMDIFYDLSADFAWDNRFSVALTRLALADNRPDLADPEYLPGGAYAEYMNDPKYANILLEDVNKPDLESTLRAAAEPKLREMDYDDDFINEYFGIKLEDTDDNRIKVTVWGELYYEELDELADVLNHIVAEEDPEAYFDHETTGRIVAYIRKDQSEDIPDEAIVAEWSERFNNCTTWEELKDVYGEFYNIRDDLNNGTHRALYDIIDKKIDELKPVEENLQEEYKVKFFQIFEAPKAPTENGKMIGQRGTLKDANSFGKEKVGEGNYIIKAVCTDGKTRHIDNDTSEDAYQMEEGLTEDAEETPAAIYSMLDASDSYVDNDDYPEGASEEEIIKIAEANPDCMKVTKWVDGMEGPDEVVWERPVNIWFVSQYEGGAEYEHAEGGYYYETLTHVDKETFKSKEAARKRLAELADEARSEGEDVVAQTDDFFRIKTGRYIGDCEEYHVEAKEGAHFSGKKVYEDLNEDVLNKLNTPEDKPYSASEIQKEIKSLTQNFTATKDTLKCGFKEENDVAVKLLKKHYKNVTTEKYGQWFEITFSEPVKKLKENHEVKTLFKNDNYIVELHPDAPKPYWVLDATVENPIHAEQCFYDEERAVRFAKEHSLNEDINTYNVTFYMDSLDDNVMSGPSTTKMIRASSEEEAKKKLMDSSTDKYYIPTVTKVELVESVETSKEWEHKDKDGKIGRIRQSDGKGDRKPLTRDQAKEIAKFRGHEDDELYPVNESKSTNEDLSSITSLADDCGKNTFNKSARDVRFTFEDEKSASKFMDKLKEKNIHYDELPRGIIKVSKASALDESTSINEDKSIDELQFKDTKFEGIRRAQFSTSDNFIVSLEEGTENGEVYYYISMKHPFDHSGRYVVEVGDWDNPESAVKAAEEATELLNNESEAEEFKTSIDSQKFLVDSRRVYKRVAKRISSKKWVMDESTPMTADEMKDKYGTDNPDIINAGKPEEERVALKEEVYYKNNYDTCSACGAIVDSSDITYEDFDKRWVRYTCPNCDNTFDRSMYGVTDDEANESLTEQMTYTDTNGFLGEPGEKYTMSQFRRMWQDKDNDPSMSSYDSFEEWVGETISQMDAHEEEPEVAPSGRGKLSCATFTDKSGIMGEVGAKYTVNDLADYWTNNNGSDPVLANYNGDWKKWLDDTLPQMEEQIDNSLYEELLNEDADDPKLWPDNKELTYEEALTLAKAYYAQGGDGFYETADKGYFDYLVKEFGPQTVKSMKQEFGVFDSVAKDRMAEDLITEAANKYELLIEPYARHEQTAPIRKVFNSNSLPTVLEYIAEEWMYGFDPRDFASENLNIECETKEEARKAIEDEFDKTYVQFMVDELMSQNGDGCGYIFYLKNLSNGEYIMKATESERDLDDSEIDLFESKDKEI